MANNLVEGNNGVVALQAADGVTFADAGFNTTNCRTIYEVGNPNKSFVPGREINPITAFVGGKGYYIVMKVPADKTAYLIPPIPSALSTPSAPTSPVTNDTANTFGWTDTGGKTFANAEYTLNAGSSWANATANPQTGIGDVARAAGQVGVRYKAVAGVSNASQALYNTTAFTVATVTPFFHATFSGPSALLADYTPENGTIAATLGTCGTDGVGNLVMQPASTNSFAVAEIGGTPPVNTRITTQVFSIVDGSDCEHALRQNGDGSQYILAQFVKVSSSTATHVISDNTGIVATQNLTGLSYPLSFITTVNYTTGEITSKVNNGTALTYTDVRTGLTEKLKIQTVNGATLSDILVESF